MTPPFPQSAHTQFSAACLHRAMTFPKATTLSFWWSSGGGDASQAGTALPSFYWGTGGASWDSTFIVLYSRFLRNIGQLGLDA